MKVVLVAILKNLKISYFTLLCPLQFLMCSYEVLMPSGSSCNVSSHEDKSKDIQFILN